MMGGCGNLNLQPVLEQGQLHSCSYRHQSGSLRSQHGRLVLKVTGVI
jgi:hypothetical protein